MGQRFSYDTVCFASTTDANWTSMETGFEVPEGTVSRLDFRITASDYGTNHVTWVISAVAKRYAGMNPVITTGGSYVVTKTATGGASWNVRLKVYNDLIKIDVLGAGGPTIDWIAVGQDPVCLYGLAVPLVSSEGLVSYWKLDESSDGSVPVTRSDFVGTNHLTDNNTCASGTGILSACTSFIAANSEYLSIASNASLETGDIDFTFSAWVQLASKSTIRNLIAKFPTISGEYEYRLFYYDIIDRYVWWVSPDGVNFTEVQATTFGSPTIGQWHHICVTHDSVGDNITIRVNGVLNTTATALGVKAGPAAMTIGARGTATEPHDGLVDEVGFWKRVLTNNECIALYNGGAGLTYPF